MGLLTDIFKKLNVPQTFYAPSRARGEMLVAELGKDVIDTKKCRALISEGIDLSYPASGSKAPTMFDLDMAHLAEKAAKKRVATWDPQALILAASRGATDVFTALLETKRIHPCQRTSPDFTSAAHAAAANGHLDIIKAIEQYAADYRHARNWQSLTDEKGRTFYDVAMENHQTEIVGYICDQNYEAELYERDIRPSDSIFESNYKWYQEHRAEEIAACLGTTAVKTPVGVPEVITEDPVAAAQPVKGIKRGRILSRTGF